MNAPNRNWRFARALMDELARAGVRDVIVSPGSRSAPLALAAADEPRLRDRSVLDERAAAFFALGLARASRRPVACVCTSGSAAAHYGPAVVEARMSGIPLVLLTADRPPELRQCAAPQTIDQTHLFGRYALHFAELPLPEAGEALLRHARVATSRAVAAATGPPAGPVHVNVPLREPLAPIEVPGERDGAEALAARGRADSLPWTAVRRAARLPDAADLDALAARIADEERGWLVAGPLDADAETSEALRALAEACGWPLLAEPLSQQRAGQTCSPLLVDAHDALLRAERLLAAHPPRRVLRFGGTATSKALHTWLAAHPEVEQWVVDADGWTDAGGSAAAIVRADAGALARALAERLAALGRPSGPSDFGGCWIEAGRRARAALERELDGGGLSEPGVVRALARSLPDGATLHVASSMPVRDVDAFWPAGARRLRFVANRGANGIDGSVATALGTAAGTTGPCVSLLGDLAFLHDVGALALARERDVSATLVVVDNDGGGIFEFLPAASATPREAFERHLATPQGADLARIAGGFGVVCTTPRDPAALEQALRESLDQPGVKLIRVKSERAANAELHAKLFERAVLAAEALA